MHHRNCTIPRQKGAGMFRSRHPAFPCTSLSIVCQLRKKPVRYEYNAEGMSMYRKPMKCVIRLTPAAYIVLATHVFGFVQEQADSRSA